MDGLLISAGVLMLAVVLALGMCIAAAHEDEKSRLRMEAEE